LEIIAGILERLINGVSGAASSLTLMPLNSEPNLHARIKNFNAELIGQKEARKMDRYAQYAMVSSEEAVNDASF
jgi:3-oxoacyl-[acyl-carrier-protein] synthase II